MAQKRSYGIGHLISVPTYGEQRRTIVATHSGGMTTIGTPLPDDAGWAYVIVLADGRSAVSEAKLRADAVLEACQQLEIDPVRILGRANADRALSRASRTPGTGRPRGE